MTEPDGRLEIVRSFRLPTDLDAALHMRAAARGDLNFSDLLRLGAAWAAAADDEDLNRFLPPVPDHQFDIVADHQRRRGWYLSWRCARPDCDVRGDLTMPAREEALRLIAGLDAEHQRTAG